jgi:UDP-GlcNAc:undecaprenyl-phosphate GlcNAc-1-phosphate transferase
MSISIIIDFLIISIIASFSINLILRNLAKRNKVLIDIPDKSRKFHKRATPLTGGLGILLATLIIGKLFVDLNNFTLKIPDFTFNMMVSSVILVILFLYDDFKGITAKLRMVFQGSICLYFILSTDTYISNLGNIFGTGDIELGLLSIPFTVFCVVGIMNAFNMIDGINGLCSGCAMIALLFIGFSSGLIYNTPLVILIGSIIGFLIFNLRLIGKKREVFLGDHGSNLIGFWVAWLAIGPSQNPLIEIEAMTMVWFVAIPLLDCLGLIFSRLSRGLSWDTPGRDHIHHKLMNRFSPEGTLLVIILLSISLCSFGLILERFFPPVISLILFIIFSITYFFFSFYYYKKEVLIGVRDV